MQPQEAFAELASITLADHTLVEVMDKIVQLAKEAVPGADEASVTMWEAGRASTIAYTGELARSLDERQYAAGHGPCLDSVQGGEPVHVADTTDEPRWPEWALEAARQGATSSFTVAIPLQREVGAALNLYSTGGGFDADSRDLALTFGAYAGVALANIHLYDAQARVAEQLQVAMASRASIEQAKGILMARERCTAEEAFTMLVAMSQRSNVKLREVADRLVQETSKQG